MIFHSLFSCETFFIVNMTHSASVQQGHVASGEAGGQPGEGARPQQLAQPSALRVDEGLVECAALERLRCSLPPSDRRVGCVCGGAARRQQWSSWTADGANGR
mgnify:CR=1 FL=1